MKKTLWVLCSLVLLSLVVSTSAMADFITDLYTGTIPTLSIHVHIYSTDSKSDVIIQTATEKMADQKVWLHVNPTGGPDNTVTADNPNGCFLELGNIGRNPLTTFYACIRNLAWVSTDYDASKSGKPTTEHARIIGVGWFATFQFPLGIGTGSIFFPEDRGAFMLRCDSVTYTDDAADTTTGFNLSGCAFDGGFSESVNTPNVSISWGFLIDGSFRVKLAPPI